MTVKFNISGPDDSSRVDVVNRNTYEYLKYNGIVAFTDPLRHFDNSPQFFTNSDYGNEMAQNAAAGGTSEDVHNGIDDVLWTATSIQGIKFTFNSTDISYDGTHSIKIDNAAIDDVFQLYKGSSLDLSGYVSLTMWINVDKDWAVGDIIQVYGWDTGTGTQIGTPIDLKDYFNYTTYNVWQSISIPLNDLGLLNETIDSLRFKISTTSGKSPKFYLDVIQFQETGDPIVYTIEPEMNSLLYIEGFHFFYADAYAGTLADATMPNIPYNKFFGVISLTNGIQYKRIQNEKVIFSTQWKNHMDIMIQPGSIIAGYGSDGTNSWVTITNTLVTPIILDPSKQDKITLTITEDLSGLLSFRVSAIAKKEEFTRIFYKMQFIKNKNIPLSLQLIKSDLTYEQNATVNYNIYNSDMTTIAVTGSELTFNETLNSYTITLASSGWNNQETGNYILVWDISNTTNFASTMVEELVITSDAGGRFDDIDTQLTTIEGNTDTIITNTLSLSGDIEDIKTDTENIITITTETSNDVKRLLGLTHENLFIDNTEYDVYWNLVRARVRIYSVATSVGTNNDVIGTYQIDCTADRQGAFTNWKQVRTS